MCAAVALLCVCVSVCVCSGCQEKKSWDVKSVGPSVRCEKFNLGCFIWIFPVFARPFQHQMAFKAVYTLNNNITLDTLHS